MGRLKIASERIRMGGRKTTDPRQALCNCRSRRGSFKLNMHPPPPTPPEQAKLLHRETPHLNAFLLTSSLAFGLHLLQKHVMLLQPFLSFLFSTIHSTPVGTLPKSQSVALDAGVSDSFAPWGTSAFAGPNVI